ncbi:IPT/TIG domain-containing protein [Streptomyces sp. NPDC048473]|uniref:IPT/TIG domain-containing protein n=1 Tax=unclassified Streptomyces TaxID=2593676 RepID=UPI00371003A3
MAVAPDNAHLYVADIATNAVTVAQRDLYTVVGTVPVGNTPSGIKVDPSGLRLYVANQGSDTLSVVNTLTDSVIVTIPVGHQPTGVAVAPTGLEVYVSNKGDNTVSVISTVTQAVVATITDLSAPLGAAISPNNTRLYIANSTANTVSIIDTATRAIIATVPVGTTPWGLAVTPDGRQVHVANNGSNSVSVIDTSTNTVIETVPVGNQPTGVAITPNGLSVYVANRGSNTISVIQTLNAMSPTLGPQAGGTILTLTGTSLAGATAVRFDTTPAAIMAGTANQIVVVTPPGVGVAQVTVTTPNGTSNSKPFVYYPRGDAHSLAPAAGPTAGRNVITIKGDQLATASQVLFGPLPTIPIVVSDSQLEIPVPPGLAPGSVPLTVTTAGGITTGTLSYRYVDPPNPIALKPTTGTVFGGNVITITGQNLSTTTLVTIKGIIAQFSIGSNVILSAVVPTSPAPGPADVTITTTAGTVTLPGAYIYT